MYVEQGRMDEAASHVPIQPENDWSRARSESSIKPTDTPTTSLLIISFTATKFMITSTEEVVEENDAATRCNSRQGTGMRGFSVAAVLLNLLKAITSCIPVPTGEARRTSEETLLVLEEQICSQKELVLYAISVFMYLARHLYSIK